MDWRDIGIRAGRTFLQAFIAVLIASKIATVSDFVNPALLDQAFVAGLAAFLSFAQSLLAGLARKQADSA